jgi:hypothetical protein
MISVSGTPHVTCSDDEKLRYWTSLLYNVIHQIENVVHLKASVTCLVGPLPAEGLEWLEQRVQLTHLQAAGMRG